MMSCHASPACTAAAPPPRPGRTGGWTGARLGAAGVDGSGPGGHHPSGCLGGLLLVVVASSGRPLSTASASDEPRTQRASRLETGALKDKLLPEHSMKLLHMRGVTRDPALCVQQARAPLMATCTRPFAWGQRLQSRCRAPGGGTRAAEAGSSRSWTPALRRHRHQAWFQLWHGHGNMPAGQLIGSPLELELATRRQNVRR